MIGLTAKDSTVSIMAVEAGGDVVLFVDGRRMNSVKHAASSAAVDETELLSALHQKGLPAYLFESSIIADYAADYWLAAETLSSTQFFKPPFLFSLGHAFELAMKGVLIYSQRKRIADVASKYRHNLTSLWESTSHWLADVTLASDKCHIDAYSKIYSGMIGDAKFFVRYPDQSHLWEKWPDSIVESVNAIGNDAWLIVRKLNSEFQNSGWQYKEWPNKTVNWTP